MNPSWITWMTFAAVALLAGAVVSLLNDLFFHYRFLVGQRLDELSGKRTSARESVFKDLKQLAEHSSVGRRSWKGRLEDCIEQSGVKITPARLATWSLGLGLAAAVLSGLLVQRWWAAPLGLLPGLAAPACYIQWKRSRRIRKFVAQLPEAFDAMARAVHAGQTVPGAFQIIADDFTAPLADEFRHCYEQQNLGMPQDVALRNLARRTGVMEMRILVVALLVQARSGGSLVQLLNNLADMARTRIKLQQKVRALTGEGRMQAKVLMVLPAIAFALLLILSPEYILTLTERTWLLGATVTAQILGALWIRRIVNFEF